MIRYTLAPVYLTRRADPLLSGAEVLIVDVTSAKGKRIAPRGELPAGARVQVIERNGERRAWVDAENLSADPL